MVSRSPTPFRCIRSRLSCTPSAPAVSSALRRSVQVTCHAARRGTYISVAHPNCPGDVSFPASIVAGFRRPSSGSVRNWRRLRNGIGRCASDWSAVGRQSVAGRTRMFTRRAQNRQRRALAHGGHGMRPPCAGCAPSPRSSAAKVPVWSAGPAQLLVAEAPRLVRMLLAHIKEFGVTADGRLFCNERGEWWPPRRTGYWRVRDEARHLALTPEQAASPLAARTYDLRHAALPSWLNAYVTASLVTCPGGRRGCCVPCGRAIPSMSCSTEPSPSATASVTAEPTSPRSTAATA